MSLVLSLDFVDGDAFVGSTYQKQIWWLLWHYDCWLSRFLSYVIIFFSTYLLLSTMWFSSPLPTIIWSHILLSFSSEAHPDVIGTDGLAPAEGYQKDLAYLKSKVLSLNQNPPFLFLKFFIFISSRIEFLGIV
jgi:hypothetical protein